MTAWKLVWRSVVYYRRTHVGVVLGAAVAAAVLVGALVVGDSVRHSLRTMALRRLGRTELAMAGLDRFFRATPPGEANDLAAAIAAELGAPVAPVLLLDGSANRPDGKARANRVQVVGVDERFWRMGGGRDLLAAGGESASAINEPLARQLGAAAGEEIVVRFPVPSGLPRDAPLASDRDAAAALRVRVRAVATEEDFGRFSLRANQLAPMTVFVPMPLLQRKAGLAGRGNVLLVGRPAGAEGELDEAAANAALRSCWRLPDADLELRDLPGGLLELRTGRVFLDPPVAEAALAADHRALPILTYFVHEIRHGERTAFYSVVTAMGASPTTQPSTTQPVDPLAPPSPVPPGLGDDEILINKWLADTVLKAGAGDRLELLYQTVGAMRTFETHKRTVHVRAVVPIRGGGIDPNLMPAFPGLAEVPNCRDWKPGIPIDLDKLTEEDEKYWNEHKGTPKAVVSLAAGQKMWANRFGSLTAVRYRARPAEADALARRILERIDPAEIGLFFLPVRRQAVAAATPTSDFGGLFLGLSFFLIVAAVLLTALLFVFNVEQRSRQAGVLLALGFRPPRVRRVLLAEGAALAAIGCCLGAFGGLAYTRVVLWGLANVWQSVSASSPIGFHAEPVTVLIGAGAGLVVAALAMYVTLRMQGRAPARELLAAGAEGRPSPPAGRGRIVAGATVGAACLVGAVALIVPAATGALDVAGAFFGSGGLLLIGGLSLCYTLLAALGRRSQAAVGGLGALGLRTTGRRRWRSLTTAGLLACGVFLVASVEVFRLDPGKGTEKRSSGTGGFALYGESALPVLHDLNDPDRRKKLHLEANAMRGVNVVQLRVREGDDASCLNLNRAQQPRLLGVEPGRLAGRFTFLAAVDGAQSEDPWTLLEAAAGPGVVPAVGDRDTLKWALHKSVGDEIEMADERGRRLRVRLVAEIAGSVLQGNLLISERRFREHFPSATGYRAFLIDAPQETAPAASEALSAAMEDYGLELTPAARRLAEFSEVQNTYLSIFAALGGLGLLLGSVAIGVVVLRNVMERRGELALLRAVGFARPQLRWMVLCEHWALLALGLGCGVVSAVVAVLPSLLSPETSVPYLSWLTTLGAVAVSGAAWTWLAATAALRGELMTALRRE